MPSITYSSTRGGQKHYDFATVVMQGLAHDRGLFVPDDMPHVSRDELELWRNLSFVDLAVQVIVKFVQNDQVPRQKLQDIVQRSCQAFRDTNVTPLIRVNNHYILELFHGPTFAFKDVALQMLGNFFEYFLSCSGGRLAVLGATSGDTGSAAIAGLRGKKNVDCIILFPNGRVSTIQEQQMTTILDHNIHCVAIDGTFDDCQDIVKASFQSPLFRDKVHLGAVNSINWCRVLAQMTYYFWSYLRVTDHESSSTVSEVHFSVPTGNFGDVLAGFYAKQMGLPIGKLIVATNENDILYRFFTKGEYHRKDIAESISPSMDICVSSNFERYLYYLAGNDSNQLCQWMGEFEATKKLTLSGPVLRAAQNDFDAARADTATTLQIIAEYGEKYNYVLCPHSAVGVSAMHQLDIASEATVCLATAHPAKFPDAVKQAIAILPPPPRELACLNDLPTRKTLLPNDMKAVQNFVEKCVQDKQESDKMVKLYIGAAVVSVAAIVLFTVIRRR